MADGKTAASTRCPVCSEGMSVSVQLSYRRGSKSIMHFDLSPVRDHLATHQAPPFSTELPPTAR